MRLASFCKQTIEDLDAHALFTISSVDMDNSGVDFGINFEEFGTKEIRNIRGKVMRLENELIETKEKLASALNEIQRLKENNTMKDSTPGPKTVMGEEIEVVDTNIAEKEKGWNQQEQKTVEMKEIIKEQEEEKERENKLEKQRLKHREPNLTLSGNPVRGGNFDNFDKNRCIMIIGDIEGHQEVRYERVKERKARVIEILKKMSDGNDSWFGEITGVRRLGRYVKNTSRPIRVEFNSRKVAKEVLGCSWRLRFVADHEKIFLRQDLNKEEREKLGYMLQDVKVRNDQRSEEQKEMFFWRVRNMRIRKWFINRRE